MLCQAPSILGEKGLGLAHKVDVAAEALLHVHRRAGVDGTD